MTIFLKIWRNLYQVPSFAIYMRNPINNLHNHFLSKAKIIEINISLWEKSFQLEEFCKSLRMSKHWSTTTVVQVGWTAAFAVNQIQSYRLAMLEQTQRQAQ